MSTKVKGGQSPYTRDLAQSDRFWIVMVGSVLDLLLVALNLLSEQGDLLTQWLKCGSQGFRTRPITRRKSIRRTGRSLKLLTMPRTQWMSCVLAEREIFFMALPGRFLLSEPTVLSARPDLLIPSANSWWVRLDL